jgi:hypothetical protein
MTPKAIKITYWTITILFALAMLGDAFGGITKQEAGQVVLRHLGYPIYIMPMYGVAKLLGVIVLLQQKFRAIKEWAYAGFVFTFISAVISRAIVGDGVSDLLPPVIMLVVALTAYFFWKKYEQVKTV